MKKIYQFGFIASLVALLPTGMLFAGNGTGDGKGTKNSVSIEGTTSGKVTLMVYTKEEINKDNITVTPKTDYSTINNINPVAGGFEVVIDVEQSTQSASNGEDEVIIIEIVGVDNITGVDATDGNTGTNIPTNIVVWEEDKDVTGSTSNNTGTGLHQNPENNLPGSEGSNTSTSPVFTGNKEDINIYPNPVREETNVVTVGEILGKSIEIIDLSGNVVVNMIVPAGSRQTQLNLSMLKPGLYILSYKTQDGKTISKRIQKI